MNSLYKVKVDGFIPKLHNILKKDYIISVYYEQVKIIYKKTNLKKLNKRNGN